jgi:hypothetical protein
MRTAIFNKRSQPRLWLWQRFDMRVLLLAAVIACLGAAQVAAQAVRSPGLASSSFITPFPGGNAYKLRVYGDSFADGLLPSVRAIIGETQPVEVATSVTRLKSLISANWDSDVSEIEALSDRDTPEIAIVMTGAYSRGSIRTPGKQRTSLGTEVWQTEYTARLRRLLAAFRKKRIAVYWIGQPIVPGPKRREHSRLINDIVRGLEVTDRFRYVDVFDAFADESGDYAAYGPDLVGKVRKLRWSDNLHFSRAGYDRIAHSVGQLIGRDIKRAKSERNVELAGDETAIKSIRARVAQQRPAAPQAGWRSYLSPFVGGSNAPDETDDDTSVTPRRERGLPDQTARVLAKLPGGGDLQIVIERPPVPGDIVSMVAKTDGRRGDAISGHRIELPAEGGYSAVAVVTPVSRNANTPVRVAQVSTQTPMFRVWHRGERLPPQENRADDTSWPRPMPVVLIPEPKIPERVSGAATTDPLVAFEAVPQETGLTLPVRNPRRVD